MEAKSRAQPSRKGKKAWRKNVDVEAITAAMDAKRDKEIALGSGDADEFVIDTAGDHSGSRPARVLRTTEILTNKSKVPALNTQPRRKVRVSKARVSTLMALAGRSKTVTGGAARAATESLVKGSETDLWGAAPGPAQDDIYRGLGSVTSYTPPTRAPVTMHEKPVALTTKAPREKQVHAGKSYNPSLDSWKSLIDREYGLEHEKEVQLQAIEEQKKKIQHLVETLDDREVIEDDSDDAGDDDAAAAGDSDDGSANDFRLSVNEPTVLRIKTRAQRNKAARHKKSLELAAEIRALKAQYRQISRLEAIEKQVAEKLASTKTAKPKTYARHGKHHASFTPIEVKLSDELPGSLRGVRPEGNLFYDQMNKLEMSGVIPAAAQLERTTRYKPKFVEKWAYKQWKQ